MVPLGVWEYIGGDASRLMPRFRRDERYDTCSRPPGACDAALFSLPTYCVRCGICSLPSLGSSGLGSN